MKKIALSLAVIATMAMVSCGNKAATEDTAAADTMEVTEEVAVATDSDSNGTTTEVAAVETAAPAEEAKADEANTDKKDAPAADKAEAPAEAPAADAAAK